MRDWTYNVAWACYIACLWPLMINYDGLYAFSTPGADFPVRVVQYRHSVYMVPDWSVNHDPGDEDDGEHKYVERLVRETFRQTVSL